MLTDTGIGRQYLRAARREPRHPAIALRARGEPPPFARRSGGCRDASRLTQFRSPRVSPQGSFRLGTVVRATGRGRGSTTSTTSRRSMHVQSRRSRRSA